MLTLRSVPELLTHDGVLVGDDGDAHLAQLGGDALQVARDDVLYAHLAAGGGAGDHIGPGLYLVGDNRVAAAVEGVRAVDLDGVRAGAAHVRAHGVEEVREVDDVRLLGGGLDYGAAAGHAGREDDVHRRADADLVEVNLGAVELAVGGLGVDKAAGDLHVGAQGGHALDVLVYGPDAEVAAAGHGGLGRAEAAEHGAYEVIARAYLAHEVVGRVRIAHVGAVYLHRVAVHQADLRAQMLEYGHEHVRVAYLRDILQPADAVHHERGGDYGHGGVLRAADLNLAVEGLAAVDYVFFQ